MQLFSTSGAAHGSPHPVTLGMGAAHIRGRLPRLREIAKLHLRAHLQHTLTKQWLAVLNSDPFLGQLADCAPQLLNKLYQPYLTRTFSPECRLRALAGHYRFILARGLDKLVLQAASGGALLSRFAGKGGTPFEIWLQAVAPMGQEGELVLQLRSGGVLVCSLVFSFLESYGVHAVAIAGIDAPAGEAGDGLIEMAAHALHGLDPKALLTGMVRDIGYDLGCEYLLLVGAANRVAEAGRKPGEAPADCDQHWTALGAIRRLDGDYQLECGPLAEPRLGHLDLNSALEVRRQHALRMDLHVAVSAHFRQAAAALMVA
jgi:hypothetical protein